ncbi:MAG: protein kinase [Lentisphaeria bacterium]|nr:protein kinase [Lentisphaeria bacterium]
MRFECSHCHGILAIENSQPGEAVACGHCNMAVAVPESALAPGAVIGDFIIRSLIGQGGMGRVFLAHQISLDRPSAVKVLHQQYALDVDYIKNFVREARAAAVLNHPSIVLAYAVGEDNGNYFFAMEYVEGNTVKEALTHSGRMVPELALATVLHVAEALNYAWETKKLVHRDIKPDNIILTNDGKAKLADLGLARWFGDAAETSGDIYGTPQYISPEQLMGKRADNQSDIYSLGATLYQMLSGEFPFTGTGPSEIAQHHLLKRLIPLHQKVDGIPKNISDLVTIMLAKRPCHRYEDTAELLSDLRIVQEGKPPIHPMATNILDPLSQNELAGGDPDRGTVSPAPKRSEYKGAAGSATLKSKSPSTTEATQNDLGGGQTAKRKIPGALTVAVVLLLGLFVQFVIVMGPVAGGLLALSPGMQPPPKNSPSGPKQDKGEEKLQEIEKMIANGQPEEAVLAALADYASTHSTTDDSAFNDLAASYRETDLEAEREAPMEEDRTRWTERARELTETAERNREEAERKTKEEAERNRREQEQREKAEKIAAQKTEFQAAQTTLREQATECCRTNQYDDASVLFAEMMGAKYQEAKEWATGMQACISYAKNLYERIYNSRDNLVGAKILLPGKKGRWTVTYIGPRSIELEQTVTKYLKGEAFKKTSKEKLLLEHMTAIHVHSLLTAISEANDVSLAELCRDFAAFLLIRNEHIDQIGKQLDKAGTAAGQEFMRAELKSLTP